MKIFTKTGKFKDFNINLSDKINKSLLKDGIDIDKSDFVRKGLTSDDMKFDEGERASIDYITTKSVDRDGDIVLPQGVILDHYKLSPIVLFGHDYNSLPIGRSAWIKSDEKGLIAKTIYATKKANPMAEMVFNLKKEGILTSKSIGFVPLEVIRRKDFYKIKAKDFGLEEEDLKLAQNIYTKWILLEHSEVSVPSNVGSINIAIAKDMDNYLDNICEGLDCDVKDDARKFFAEMYDKSDSGIKEYGASKEIDNDMETEEKDITINVTVTNTETSSEPEDEIETEMVKPEVDEEIEQKIEVTADFIHIPVRSASLFLENSFRTIDISQEKGIKAVVGRLASDPGGGVVVQKYLFDKDMWSEGEAQTWVSNHSKSIEISENVEIKNIENKESEIEEKSNDFMKTICKEFYANSLKEKNVDLTINKMLDITEIPSIPATFNLDVFSRYLDVDVKDIFQNDYSIPNVMLGTQLAGFKSVLDEFEFKDERNFQYDGSEKPLKYNVIQLNSKESQEFLVEGTKFYNSDNGPIAIKFYPTWGGIAVSIYTSKNNSEFNKSILNKVDIWVEKNNHLKGEKFSVTGEFLSKSDITWDDVILTPKNKDILKKNIKNISEVSKSRGLMLVGPGGTGKTLIGKAMIKETDNTFLWAYVLKIC